MLRECSRLYKVVVRRAVEKALLDTTWVWGLSKFTFSNERARDLMGGRLSRLVLCERSLGSVRVSTAEFPEKVEEANRLANSGVPGKEPLLSVLNRRLSWALNPISCTPSYCSRPPHNAGFMKRIQGVKSRTHALNAIVRSSLLSKTFSDLFLCLKATCRV